MTQSNETTKRRCDMKAKSLLLAIGCFLFLFVSCRVIETPKTLTFKYYDKKFDIGNLKTLLRTDGLYLKYDGIVDNTSDEYCSFFAFFENGLVRQENTLCGLTYDRLMNFNKNLYGYYKIQNQSILFTIKHIQTLGTTEHFGTIYKDSLVINYMGNKNDTINETYYFRPSWYIPINGKWFFQDKRKTKTNIK